MEPSLNQNGILEYLRDLGLERPRERFDVRSTKSPAKPETIKEDMEQAFISDKSVVSFAANVKDQNRKDILNSTLLAQLAANKKSPIETDITAWYKAYVEVLEKIGWVVQNKEIHKFEAKADVFEVENVIIDILTASFGANYIAIIKKTLDSLKKLTNSGDGRIKVFDRNTRASNKGCFQLAAATEEKNAVAMNIGAFMLSSTNKVTSVLFIKFASDKTTLQYASTGVTLNEPVYANARKLVLEKLSQDVIDYIAEIDI